MESEKVLMYIPHMDLGQIEASGQCFRMRKREAGGFSVIAGERYLEIYPGGGARETGKDPGAEVQGFGEALENDIGRLFEFSCGRDEFGEFWSRYFDLETDYGKIREKVAKRDRYLARAVENGWGIRILRQDPWEMVVTFIISQQNNIPRIKKCVELLCRRFGREMVNFRGEIYFGFPGPGVLAEAGLEALKECNLGYRARYILETARMILEGDVSLEGLEKLGHDEAKKELMKLCGVGDKVAECVCLFGFHYVDAFPVDTHIAQVLERHYPDGFPFKRYKGFAGILQQYIFYDELHGRD